MDERKGQNVHLLIHAVKGTFCLCEEVIDDTFAKLAHVVIIVHLEYLVKGCLVYDIPEVRCRTWGSFALAIHSDQNPVCSIAYNKTSIPFFLKKKLQAC